MGFTFLLLATLAIQQIFAAEKTAVAAELATAVEGRDAGYGYGYDDQDQGYGGNQRQSQGYGRNQNQDQGYGRNQQMSQGYGGHQDSQDSYGQQDSYGHRDSYGQSRGNNQGHNSNSGHQRHVPIKIPYMDLNGCRFPGDVTCVAGDLTMYNLCVLADESKNLWKRPTMSVLPAACTGTEVIDDFCNDNEKLLRAAGLIQEKGEKADKKFYLGKYVVTLNPCIRLPRA